MISRKSQERKCLRCGKTKSAIAFIGLREACRECWLGLTEEEKREQVLWANTEARKIHQNRWEDKKRLKKEREEQVLPNVISQ